MTDAELRECLVEDVELQLRSRSWPGFWEYMEEIIIEARKRGII